MNRKLMAQRLEERGLTDFQIKILLATMEIPKGRTATYKEIAARAGYPGASRAAGTALRKNPFPIAIPCHRVVKSSGETGSYSGRSNSRIKKELLKKEGAI